jgi:hypothetical protein
MLRRFRVYSDGYYCMEESETGVYVLYEDYAKALDALRKCHKSLCAYIDRDNNGSDPTSKYDAIGAANAAFWVIDDGPS